MRVPSTHLRVPYAKKPSSVCVRIHTHAESCHVSHARMLQPSSSGVMHAKPRARTGRRGHGSDGPVTGNYFPVTSTRNACMGTHGTCCACRCFRELVALRCSAASTRPALVVHCGIIFRRLPCLQTRYIVEIAEGASVGARSNRSCAAARIHQGRLQEAGFLFHESPCVKNFIVVTGCAAGSLSIACCLL